ncbi:ATP-dependent DNA helicase [Homoserinimonas sp. OAct 916]|uniref:ATP-dependent helicase n=1 Tax=Homoserinimonas sp. OAct 916 TaxID=2211450 RepID=UPI001E3A9ECD|nr:ATP-dependent DNA helicase [Homoserinimonas sp. OAct 916]
MEDSPIIETGHGPGAQADTAPSAFAGAQVLVDAEPTGLDDSQRAVLALDDDETAAVLGGPGTGKTHTIVELVAERVELRGWSPDRVLVLAATRTSATRLRDRIALRLGIPTGGPVARTANSVAFQIVQEDAAIRGLEPPTLLTGGEQDQIIADLIRGDLESGTGPDWPEPLDADVRGLRGFRTQLRDLMARCVEYGLSTTELAELARQAHQPQWSAAAEFIQVYDEVKASFRDRHFDSAELVRQATWILNDWPTAEAGALATSPLAGIRLVVLDDAQESTQSTMTLVRALHARGAAVIAFGDPDLTCGTFRGARPDTLSRLGRYLADARGVGPAVTTMSLTTDHRRGKELGELHQKIVGHIGTAGAFGHRRVVSAAAAGSGPEVQAGETRAGDIDRIPLSCAHATSPEDEIAIIARRLRERHIFGGVPWRRMAVIVRSGATVPSLVRGLAALEVPTREKSPQTALRDHSAVRAMTSALDIALGRTHVDAEAVIALLTGPLGGLDPVGLRRLKAALRHQELESDGRRGADELLVEAISLPGSLAAIDTAVARRAERLRSNLHAAGEAARSGASIEELLWGLWERSGLAMPWYEQALGQGIIADEANRNLDAVVALFSSARRFVERTPDFPPSQFLDQLADADVPEDSLAPRAAGQAITVSTPAGVIGEEFDVVVIARVQEGVWPDLRVRGSLLGAQLLADLASGGPAPHEGAIEDDPSEARTAVLHDELRMFAQAASRARSEVFITAVADEDSVPSPFFRLLPPPDESAVGGYPLSLRGLVGRLRRDLTRNRDADAARALARLAAENVPGADPHQWYGLAPISVERPLVDLEAPDATVWVSPSRMDAYEKCPLHWLLGQIAPGASGVAQGLGTVIHSAMEHAAEGEEPTSADALWDSVDGRWGELAFDASWESEVARARAREMTGRLASYLRDAQAAGATLLGAELRFKLPIPLEQGTVQLSGSIDRVEAYPNGTAVIVDLKTGKNEPTSDAAVAKHSQLGAYQLAFADGALAEVTGDLASGGAKLVIISAGTQKKNYYDPGQLPFDDEQLAAFRNRVVEDATGMAGAIFVANVTSHCVDPYSFGDCRVQIIKAVSA